MKAQTINKVTDASNRNGITWDTLKGARPSLWSQVIPLQLLFSAALLSAILFSCIGTNNASALTYQSTINPEFTINPAINVSLSSADLIINDLEPGTTKDSNIITVTVSTNNSSGYTLGSTVGNSTTYDYDALKNNVDNTKSFTNLTSTGSLTAGKWGYSYSNDNGTNWSTYNGLPLYSTTPVEIASSTSATTTNTQFKIGAYATTGQAAGEYNNVVNFIATASPEPVDYCRGSSYDCLQEVTTATCPTIVTDVIDGRDGNVYKVQKLADNKCWMLDNLRLDPTAVDLDTLQGKTNASDTTLGYLKGVVARDPNTDPNGEYATAAVSAESSTYSYSAPLIDATDKNNTAANLGSGSGKIGVYYNYCAASAGSYCYGNGTSVGTPSGNATEDLCPAGWRMPIGSTSGEPSALANAIYGSTGQTSDPTAVTNYRTALSLPLSGYFNFDSGSAELQNNRAFWWSSTLRDNSVMNTFYVDASNVLPANYVIRYTGLTLRCIAQ